MVSKNKAIALKWIKAFNELDIKGLLHLYSENAVHYSPSLKKLKPETHGMISGKSKLKEWWMDAFNRLPNLHYELKNLTANDHSVCMEYIRKVPGEADIMVAEVLEIDDLIISSRVYHG